MGIAQKNSNMNAKRIKQNHKARKMDDSSYFAIIAKVVLLGVSKVLESVWDVAIKVVFG